MIVSDLCASGDTGEIIKNVNLKCGMGEVHVIMGPNGAGKSTLAKVMAGHPSYEVVNGSILLGGEDISNLDPEDRAKKGLFVGFQYPLEISGISNMTFLHNAYCELHGKISSKDFESLVDKQLDCIGMPRSFLYRSVNDAFSGGEKKRNEILQMLVLNPKYIVLDETDSGLDIDSLKMVSKSINGFVNKEKSLVLITHYHRWLNYINISKVHIMVKGAIVKSGDLLLAEEIDRKGYNFDG